MGPGKPVKKVSSLLKILRRNTSFLRTLLKDKNQRNYAFSWLLSLRKNYLLHKPSPWITFGAIKYLDNYLKTHQQVKVFEYGSGGSTLYWLKKGARCVSIEHDPEWFSLINSKVKNKSLLDYKLILPVKSTSAQQKEWDPSNPFLYATGEDKEHNFEEYVRQIDFYPDNHFDIILIDGRARTSCIFQSYSKLKAGGILVLDNADREYYLTNTRQYLASFTLTEFTGCSPMLTQIQQTNIYFK